MRTFVFSGTDVGSEKVGALWATMGASIEKAADLTGVAQANRAAIVMAEAVLRLTII